MERAYNAEKKQIIDDLINKKAWIIGDLTAPLRLRDPEFDAEKFWMEWMEKEIKWLAQKYEPYIQVSPQEDNNPLFDNKHMWIGINPCKTDEGDMRIIYEKLFKADLGKWKWQANVEQNTEEGRRPHIHMILHNDIRPNRVIKKLCEVFDCAPNFIDCKTSYELDKHEKYIRGYKKEEKMPRVHLDREHRREKNIPDVYFSKKGYKERKLNIDM